MSSKDEPRSALEKRVLARLEDATAYILVSVRKKDGAPRGRLTPGELATYEIMSTHPTKTTAILSKAIEIVEEEALTRFRESQRASVALDGDDERRSSFGKRPKRKLGPIGRRDKGD